MKPYSYGKPATAIEAVQAASGADSAVFLAGGTNLIDHLKLGVTEPERVIDVTALTSRSITEDGGGLVIGAGVPNSDLASDRRVRQRYPMLAEALLSGASPQLRNMASTGGNPLQRTRCVYFRDVSTPCNKREPGSGCAALGGYTRYHAILGASEHCVATHPSDMAVALAAMDATVHLLGPDGERTLPFTALHRLPGEQPEYDTVLRHGELITALSLPDLPIARRSTYRKVRDRAAYAFALVSVAAAVSVADGVIDDVRLALGGVAHKPWRASRAEDMLRGARPTERNFRAAAEAELEDAQPLEGIDGGNAFKLPLVARTVTATLRDLTHPDGEVTA